jgi:hypothetical protein
MWTKQDIDQFVLAFTAEDRPQAARLAMLDVMRKYGGGADVLADVGEALISHDRPDEAKRLFECALALTPDNAGYREWIARAESAAIAQATAGLLPAYPDVEALNAIMTPLIALGRLEWLVDVYDRADPTLVRRSGQTHEKLMSQEAAIERGIPPITMVTLPKSGTMYSIERITKQFDIPHFPLGLGTFPKDLNIPKWVRNLARGGAISIEHTDASEHNLATYRDAGIDRIVVHVRDPRQSLLSWIHHVELLLDGQWDLLNQHMPALPRDYGRFDWVRKLEWHVHNTFPDRVRWVEQWVETALSAAGPKILFTTYEDFHRDANAFYTSIYAFFGLGKIDRQIEVQRVASTHFRKGETDEWRQVFSELQKSAMSELMSEELLKQFAWKR